MKTYLIKSDPDIKEAFYKLDSFKSVAALLEVKPQVLRHLLYENKAYKSFSLPKKNGKNRQISTPSFSIKTLQRKLNKVLYLTTKPKRSAHGYIPGKDIRSNANPHVGAGCLLNVDLKDFFPSITFARVFGLFQSKPFSFNRQVAATLANICCYNGTLPQGAPSSPIISNLILRKLDSELTTLASKNRCFYTRYADDLTFSTYRNSLPLNMLDGLLAEKTQDSPSISSIIHSNKFIINDEKVRVRTKSSRQSVTGLTVNAKVNVDRRFIRRIRAAINDWEQNGYTIASDNYKSKYITRLSRAVKPSQNLSRVLKGQIEHLGHVRGKNDPIYLKYLQKLHKLTPCVVTPREFNKKIRPYLDRNTRLQRAVWVVESTSSDDSKIEQSTAFAIDKLDLLIGSAHGVIEGKAIVYQPKYRPAKLDVVEIFRDEKHDISLLRMVEPNISIDKLHISTSAIKNLDHLLICGFPNHNGVDGPHFVSTHKSSDTIYQEVPHIVVAQGISSGISGGPLTDLNGNVAGMAVRGANSSSETEAGQKNLVLSIQSLIKVFQANNIL